MAEGPRFEPTGEPESERPDKTASDRRPDVALLLTGLVTIGFAAYLVFDYGPAHLLYSALTPPIVIAIGLAILLAATRRRR